MTTYEIKAKHPLAIRWFHWFNFPFLTLMIWSGMLIYWANDIYFVGWGDRILFKFFPEEVWKAMNWEHRLSEGMAWHFLLMWFFVINGALYVSYTAISREWRHLLPERRSFGDAFQVVLHDLGIRKEPLPYAKYNGAQRIAYTGVVAMGVGSLLTGLVLFRPVQFSWIMQLLGGYEAARAEHFALTVGYVMFFGVYLAQVVKAGWNNFRAMVVGQQVEEVAK